MIIYLPSVSDLLKIGLFSKKTATFFRTVVEKNAKDRNSMKNPPNDYLQFSIDANVDNDFNSIIADVVTFLGDVYKSSSTTLAFLFYYLSKYLRGPE